MVEVSVSPGERLSTEVATSCEANRDDVALLQEQHFVPFLDDLQLTAALVELRFQRPMLTPDTA